MNFSTLTSALRSHLRVPSIRGLLTIEQLFDVPLRASNGFSLDAIAQAQARVVRDLEIGSFVDGSSKQLQEATAILDVVKWVIDIMLTEEAQRQKAAAVRVEEKRILDALQARQAQRLAGATEDELLAQLKALRGN